MDKNVPRRRRIKLEDGPSQQTESPQKLTYEELDQLLPLSQRHALDLPFFGWASMFVPASAAATMLGVGTAQFRKLSRAHASEIGQLKMKGRHLFLTRDLLLMKARLNGLTTGAR